MSWYFKVTQANGLKSEEGPYSDESEASTKASDYATEFPDATVGDPEEKAVDYEPLAQTARVVKTDGSEDIYYNDGSIVNVS